MWCPARWGFRLARHHLAGAPVFTTAFLFFASFIVLFTIGGVSGFMTGSVPVDWQLTDTYFVVAHLHYVLIGINVFPVVGATYFWFPKMTGKLMDERWEAGISGPCSAASIWASFPCISPASGDAASHLYLWRGYGLGLAQPHHDTGFIFICRRCPALHLECGEVYRYGVSAGTNPWDAPSLEWATTSPPPPYNFTVIPNVASRHPLWEDRLEDPERKEKSFIGVGLALDQGKETLATTSLDAEPDLILKMPDDTLVPLLLALCLTVIAVGLALVNWWVVILGGLCTATSIAAWLWPEAKLGETAVPAVTERGNG